MPEDIGPVDTFTDEEYMSGYLRFMGGWKPPSAYGCTQRHRERARREWRKLIAKIKQGAAK